MTRFMFYWINPDSANAAVLLNASGSVSALNRPLTRDSPVKLELLSSNRRKSNEDDTFYPENFALIDNRNVLKVPHEMVNTLPRIRNSDDQYHISVQHWSEEIIDYLTKQTTTANVSYRYLIDGNSDKIALVPLRAMLSLHEQFCQNIFTCLGLILAIPRFHAAFVRSITPQLQRNAAAPRLPLGGGGSCSYAVLRRATNQWHQVTLRDADLGWSEHPHVLSSGDYIVVLRISQCKIKYATRAVSTVVLGDALDPTSILLRQTASA